MNCRLWRARPGIVGIALLALACPGLAQEAPKDLISFKAVLTGSPATVIPVLPGSYPPQTLVSITLKGTSPTLGELTYQDTHVGFMGLDGTPRRVPSGQGTLALASGDRLYVDWTGVLIPSDTPGVFRTAAQATITGGTGQFAGVLGDATQTWLVDATKTPIQVTVTWDATLARPRQ
jgi:hypothetical protein